MAFDVAGGLKTGAQKLNMSLVSFGVTADKLSQVLKVYRECRAAALCGTN